MAKAPIVPYTLLYAFKLLKYIEKHQEPSIQKKQKKNEPGRTLLNFNFSFPSIAGKI